MKNFDLQNVYKAPWHPFEIGKTLLPHRLLSKSKYHSDISKRDLSTWEGLFFIVFAKYTLFRLKTHTVIAGGLAKMLGAVTAEVRERCEVHQVGYLSE